MLSSDEHDGDISNEQVAEVSQSQYLFEPRGPSDPFTHNSHINPLPRDAITTVEFLCRMRVCG